MDLGRISSQLELANAGSNGAIHVHLSNAWFERSTAETAQIIFREYRIYQTAHQNGVLIYMNSKKKKFSIIFDEKVRDALGIEQCERFSKYFADDLHITHAENALIQLIRNLGFILKKHFPLEN